MKLASYNLRQGGSTQANNHWQQLLRDFSPDLVFAQETQHPKEYFPPEEYAAFNGCVHAHVPHGKWGSAILSRRFRLEPLALPDFGGWVVGAKILNFEIGGMAQSVQVFSVHAPSPGPYEPAVNRILDEIGKLRDGTPMIIAGDFNLTTAVRHPLESSTPSNTKGERSILTRLRREFGQVNAWQILHPNENLPQTLRWTNNPTVPYHCDAVFLSHNYLPHLVSATIEDAEHWGTLSDHNPVVVTLD